MLQDKVAPKMQGKTNEHQTDNYDFQTFRKVLGVVPVRRLK